MYAVIRTGGKQYRVAPNDVVSIEKLDAAPGEDVAFDDVLMVGGAEPLFGTPTVPGARVTATVVEQARADKIIVFRKKRRQNFRRKRGHRQELTVIRVGEILTAGSTSAA